MKCKVCGKEVEKFRYSNNICSEECFHVDFWNRALDDKAIIINGVCYHDGGRKSPDSAFLGFYGQEFRIKMNDGRIIETNNLWMQGDVPKERNVKDNARFLRRDEKGE